MRATTGPHRRRRLGAAALALLVLAAADAAARPGPTGPLIVTQHRTYRQGVVLVLDAIVENVSPQVVEAAQVAVEFYSFFDELLRVEPAVLQPPTLGPGHKASLRVGTPWSEHVRKIRFRFTWRAGGEQFQNRPEDEPPVWR